MLFVGDDWAEDHHDIEVQDEQGRRLGRARLPEGIAGLARLHELIAEHLGDDDVDPETGFVAQSVLIGIETDRGTWVSALVAAGYQVFPLNPVQVARYRERHGASGAKSDRGDAHVLAEIVRLDRAHHRPIAGDSPQVEGLKLVARSHQAFIWDRTRHFQRLRSALREFFPAALDAFPELVVPEALELLERAPDPARAARLSKSKITAALTRAHRRDPEAKAEAIQAVLRAPALRQDPAIEAAYAVIVASPVRLITQLNKQIDQLQAVVAEGFGRHPDAEIVISQPGAGTDPRCPGAGGVRRRPRPLRRRQGRQELRRHLPDHPRLGHPPGRAGPLRPQQTPGRRHPPVGLLRAHRLTRRPRLLRLGCPVVRGPRPG